MEVLGDDVLVVGVEARAAADAHLRPRQPGRFGRAPGPNLPSEADLLAGRQPDGGDHFEERGAEILGGHRAANPRRHERQKSIPVRPVQMRSADTPRARRGGSARSFVVEPARGIPAHRVLERDALGEIQHDAQGVNDVGPAHRIEPVVRVDGLRAARQPVAARHLRVEPPRLGRQQQQRRARERRATARAAR